MVSDDIIQKVLRTEHMTLKYIEEDPNRIPFQEILSTAFIKTLEKYPVVK